MALADIPLFSMLKSRLGYLSERQRLISQNVANSDTPGYAPEDLTPFQVKDMHLDQNGSASLGVSAPLAPVITQPGHLGGVATPAQPFAPNQTADSETRLDGNKVVLEEEMMKMTDARMNYAATIGFYEKSMNMIQLAIRSPGKGA